MMLVTTQNPERQRSNAGDPASEKRSLAAILRDDGPIPVTDAVDVALDVCEELARAHSNGIVHGDLGMHRVRTHWPRRPGQRVDIFALGENDSAAFSFRATAATGLVAPEQRENRAVDVRADVWAVGAMLHWMIAGISPGAEPVERVLAKAPRTLAVAIQACLEVDPAKRPQTVDELAEVIASFASSPPDRFEQLARRRTSLEKAKHVRSDLGDVERVLGRLDDAALQRELAAASTSHEEAGALDRLVLTVHQTTGSAIFEKSVPMIDLAGLADEQENIETVLAAPRYGERVEETGVPVTSPLSIAPVVLSSELLAPPKDAEPAVAPTPSASAPVLPLATSPASRKPWMIALGAIGAIAAVSLGVGIGMRVVERALADHAAPPAETSAVAPAAMAPALSTTAAHGSMPTIEASPKVQAEAPATATGAAPATATPVVVTPDALPDARPVSVAALPDVHVTTPASLPDAKPAPARPAVTPPKITSSDATSSERASSAAEASPTSLSDALR